MNKDKSPKRKSGLQFLAVALNPFYLFFGWIMKMSFTKIRILTPASIFGTEFQRKSYTANKHEINIVCSSLLRPCF